MNMSLSDPAIKQSHLPSRITRCALIGMGALILAAGPAFADNDDDDNEGIGGICTRTATLARKACRAELADDFRIAKAICINIGDTGERQLCKQEAQAEKVAAQELCEEQFNARLEVCDLIGDGRYDPDFDPANFLSQPVGNTYFPLAVGNRWVYQGIVENDEGEEVTETIQVTVLADTKNIEGVTCLVVNDVVDEDGHVIEDTDDWYAHQSASSDIWYCGEIARDFETFEGDNPPNPELVSIEGSFKAGRDGDKPGILIRAAPKLGETYRQEFSLGNAEDVAQVLSTTYVFGGETDNPESLDYLVPEDLANTFCNDAVPCLVTREFTPIDPGVEERKYYAPEIGKFLEVNLESGEIIELVECNLPGC